MLPSTFHFALNKIIYLLCLHHSSSVWSSWVCVFSAACDVNNHISAVLCFSTAGEYRPKYLPEISGWCTRGCCCGWQLSLDIEDISMCLYQTAQMRVAKWRHCRLMNTLPEQSKTNDVSWLFQMKSLKIYCLLIYFIIFLIIYMDCHFFSYLELLLSLPKIFCNIITEVVSFCSNKNTVTIET